MTCFVTIAELVTSSARETALFINKDFIVSVRPDEGADGWLNRLAEEYAAMHDAEIITMRIDLEENTDWESIESNPFILQELSGDTQHYLEQSGYNEIDYIDALETILMRSYMEVGSVA